MQPIQFACHAVFPLPAESIAAQILELDRWPEFSGYGPLPGIRSAEFEVRTPEVVGTRIRVTNRDGSRHVEEIVEWHPRHTVRLQFGDFSPPVSRLATQFEETWRFEESGEATHVTREFALHPKSRLARMALWLNAKLLKRAVDRHLEQMGAAMI
jgi:hypothetical protein